MTSYYIGVDVGTQSVRSSLLDSYGREHNCSVLPLKVSNPKRDHFEQSCQQIWDAVCRTVGDVIKSVSPGDVKGIGFDGTCSLVVLDETGSPLPISQEEGEDNTCLMWMDHRAELETIEVNKTKSPVTRYVGGGFSPEQQPPKLLWLKRHLPAVWHRASNLMDLPDWLTYKATDNTTRSLCSVTCKWGYVLERGGWDPAFLRDVGLEDLIVGFEKLGTVIRAPGGCIPGGVSEQAARKLGLAVGTAVGVSLIDAHAGALALLRYTPDDISGTLCVISGTSTCIMALSDTRTFVPGVWGPYQGALLPDTWLYEGGQTAAGSALDHLVRSLPAFTPDITYTSLNESLGDLTSPGVHERSRDYHVVPDLHGNRSPLALPWFRGMFCGVSLDHSPASLHLQYLATVQGLALGVRMVMEQLRDHGLGFRRIVLCGGLADNPLYLHVLASVTQMSVTVPRGGNMMCAGSAILAQAAALHKPLTDILTTPTQLDQEVYNPISELRGFYDRKFGVYQKMCNDQIEYRRIMSDL